MFVMLFFYWRIYRAAIRTTRAINQGFRTTKGKLMLAWLYHPSKEWWCGWRRRMRTLVEHSGTGWRQLRMSGACCLHLFAFHRVRLILRQAQINMIWCLLMLQLCRRNDDACPPAFLSSISIYIFLLFSHSLIFPLSLLTHHSPLKMNLFYNETPLFAHPPHASRIARNSPRSFSFLHFFSLSTTLFPCAQICQQN